MQNRSRDFGISDGIPNDPSLTGACTCNFSGESENSLSCSFVLACKCLIAFSIPAAACKAAAFRLQTRAAPRSHCRCCGAVMAHSIIARFSRNLPYLDDVDTGAPSRRFLANCSALDSTPLALLMHANPPSCGDVALSRPLHALQIQHCRHIARPSDELTLPIATICSQAPRRTE